MRRTALPAALRMAAAILPILAATPRSSHAATVIPDSFSVLEDPAFRPVDATLRTLLDPRHGGRANHFCVIGQRLEDGSRQAWVLWREGRAIILWEPAANGVTNLRWSRRYLRLGRDIVPDDDPRLSSSTYMTGLGWFRDLAAQCRAMGSAFSLR